MNVIFVKLRDIYGADQIADQIMDLVPYEAKSWSREFFVFLDRLRMQNATAYLISAFNLVASSFAIASRLIGSVLRKSKLIGILKAIGARRRQILRISCPRRLRGRARRDLDRQGIHRAVTAPKRRVRSTVRMAGTRAVPDPSSVASPRPTALSGGDDRREPRGC